MLAVTEYFIQHVAHESSIRGNEIARFCYCNDTTTIGRNRYDHHDERLKYIM